MIVVTHEMAFARGPPTASTSWTRAVRRDRSARAGHLNPGRAHRTFLKRFLHGGGSTGSGGEEPVTSEDSRVPGLPGLRIDPGDS
jgi:hypothetical protein